jgi:DNA-binding MurR/RpiR family transcriptional regulator
MSNQTNTGTAQATSFFSSSTAIIEELNRTLLALSEPQIHSAVQCLLSARRVFFVGAGRTTRRSCQSSQCEVARDQFVPEWPTRPRPNPRITW